jgi:hypothetical protein
LGTEEEFSFEATIEEGPRGGALVEVPLDVRKTFGTGGMVKVLATFDGHSYRGSLAPMGGRHILGVTKPIRAATGKGIGEVVEVRFRVDTQPRVVEVPPDLQEALGRDPAAQRRFEKLSYTHRKEFVNWVLEARKPDTRERRVAKTLGMLKEGRTR